MEDSSGLLGVLRISSDLQNGLSSSIGCCMSPGRLNDPTSCADLWAQTYGHELALEAMVQRAILNFPDFQCFTIFRSIWPDGRIG